MRNVSETPAWCSPNGDDSELAQRMLQLLGDPPLQRALAERARQRARSFAPAPFIDRYVALLRQLGSKAGSSKPQQLRLRQCRR